MKRVKHERDIKVKRGLNTSTRGEGLFRIFFSRLANQLILTFTLTISLFIIALIFVTYNRTNNILINDFIKANQSILRLLNLNFENYVAQIDELSVAFRRDFKFMDILLLNSPGYQDETYLQNQFKIMFYSRDDIEELRFYIPGSGKLYSISRKNNGKMLIETNRGLAPEEWYQKSVRGEFFRYIEPLAPEKENASFSKDRAFFTFHRALVSIPGWKPLGIVSLSFNRSILDKMIRDTFNQKGEAVCIYDQNNQPFYISDSGLADLISARELIKTVSAQNLTNRHFRTELGGQEYLVVFDSSKQTVWKMAKLIPVKLINQKLRHARNLWFLIGGVFILILIMIIIIVSHTITSPLRKLTSQMDRVGEGNFSAKVEVQGSSELIRLAERFNDMVDQIQQLINEKYLAQINEKTARLKALEAQINPHFLYNSLQAIATRAVLGGMKDISRMIEALAYILRYCVKGGDQVRISEEMEHIRKYLLLQSVRFEDRLAVEIEPEEEFSDILIPKLSIHTLVENAIQHALEHMTRAITIQISTYPKPEGIIIRVTDNGPGMTPAHLQQVTREMREGTWRDQPDESVGLKNLFSRLKLMYGEEARLEITSDWGKGTEARIILPPKKPLLMQTPGGEGNVSGFGD